MDSTFTVKASSIIDPFVIVVALRLVLVLDEIGSCCDDDMQGAMVSVFCFVSRTVTKYPPCTRGQVPNDNADVAKAELGCSSFCCCTCFMDLWQCTDRLECRPLVRPHAPTPGRIYEADLIIAQRNWLRRVVDATEAPRKSDRKETVVLACCGKHRRRDSSDVKPLAMDGTCTVLVRSIIDHKDFSSLLPQLVVDEGSWGTGIRPNAAGVLS